jgi:hypothetical protein
MQLLLTNLIILLKLNYHVTIVDEFKYFIKVR